MKAIPIITAIAVSLAMAMPVAAHHLCNTTDENGICPEEIGDVEGAHEDAVQETLEMMDDMTETGLNKQEELDPSTSEGGPGERVIPGAGGASRGILVE